MQELNIDLFLNNWAGQISHLLDSGFLFKVLSTLFFIALVLILNKAVSKAIFLFWGVERARGVMKIYYPQFQSWSYC